jgi:hypothetical protein
MASIASGRRRPIAFSLLGFTLLACGARSALEVGAAATGGSSTSSSATISSSGSVSSSSSSSSTGCMEGATQVCGSNVGACKYGHETCHDGVFGPCVGGIGPQPEACNGIDENCNGTVDDCDPGSGTCTPTLLVTGSTPSSPNCIDFPVMKGSQGSFTYMCPGSGGTVTAVLGGISFTGTVTNNMVMLDGVMTMYPPQTPDGCTWQYHHHIQGSIQSLMLEYHYSEMVIAQPPNAQCWLPCTEDGTVQISFP